MTATGCTPRRKPGGRAEERRPRRRPPDRSPSRSRRRSAAAHRRRRCPATGRGRRPPPPGHRPSSRAHPPGPAPRRAAVDQDPGPGHGRHREQDDVQRHLALDHGERRDHHRQRGQEEHQPPDLGRVPLGRVDLQRRRGSTRGERAAGRNRSPGRRQRDGDVAVDRHVAAASGRRRSAPPSATRRGPG